MEFIVPEILENRARDYPDKAAVVMGSESITYRELDEPGWMDFRWGKGKTRRGHRFVGMGP